MLRKRSRAVSSKPNLMADYVSDTASVTEKFNKPSSSSFFGSPRLFTGFGTKGFSESDTATSPTSILDSKPFTGFGSHFWPDTKQLSSPRSNFEQRRALEKMDSKGIGLGIVDSLTTENNDKDSKKPDARMVVFGSHLKISIPPYDPTLVSQASPLNLADSSPFLSKPRFDPSTPDLFGEAQFGCPENSRETQFGYSNSSSSVPFSPSNHFGPANPTSSSETGFMFSNSLPFSPKHIFYSVASANSSETQLGGLNSLSSSPFSHENPAYSSETRFGKSNSNSSLPLSPQNVIISPRRTNFSGAQIGNSSESTERPIVHSTSKGSLLFSPKNLVDSASFVNSSGTGLVYLNSNGSQGSSFQLEKRVIDSKDRVNSMEVSSPLSVGSPRVFTGCLSASEMEQSEDYTCIISHGPNSRTTHIFDNCVVESPFVGSFSTKKENWAVYENQSTYPSHDFLSICFACKKKLGQGEDIFMYRSLSLSLSLPPQVCVHACTCLVGCTSKRREGILQSGMPFPGDDV
ncbi:uncharacterized protein LOC18421374 isoform X1 [Amborella trichopoda]|uniref:uncharacterized protein LOC18421374 isoform X1 n=1 Tax=Amborella trichopoda TaxID=13333 RepID=UPI0009BD41F0|nr:uncharacterized protein LOC18421374 isoform X1 [Amborella trichopoda]|eukprot:XP_020526224.1 uncharacterized protein LOC18421374 isoform X1 [Amborella trichopoda]